MGPLGCPEMSVTTYQSTLCNVPEERIYQLEICKKEKKLFTI